MSKRAKENVENLSILSRLRKREGERISHCEKENWCVERGKFLFLPLISKNLYHPIPKLPICNISTLSHVSDVLDVTRKSSTIYFNEDI